MPRRFYTRRVPFFQNVAMLILCIVFFLLPFSLRGARMAVSSMQNNVADWLPGHYEETQDLADFRKFFVGDTFVVVSGPWCMDGNPSYALLLRKIFEESLEYEAVLREQNDDEIIRAHRTGDKYGLMPTGNWKEDWGEQGERWLMGHDDKWFFINRQGDLYQWEGENNVVEGAKRFFERTLNGRNRAEGRFVDHFGNAPDDAAGVENIFYQNPELLCARPFKSVTTGPAVLEKMAGPEGSLRIGRPDEKDAAAFEAQVEAHRRLTGALFGPTPPKGYSWSFESLLNSVEDPALLAQLKSSPLYREKFDAFMQFTADQRFKGDRTALGRAPAAEQLELWYLLWDTALELPAPPRQTCLIVTINEPFLGELDRIVGRPLMGRQRGRLLELATGKCGLLASNVHMGGPSSDNVAIDEEGSKTLLRLASLSGLIGILLSYYSFRSFRVTVMLFFVGGVSAISSLAYVWFGGHTLDAILMTMPSLIYVGAISGSVHIVNYYRDACHEHGPKRAAEIAVSSSWFPCFLASFTTAIGLGSLCTSSLMPIWKFGFYSAIGTMATMIFMYSYLPSSLVVWPPGYRKLRGNEQAESGQFFVLANRFFERCCTFIIRHNVPILITACLAIGVFAWGVTKLETTVQLLKLFDKNAKVLQDYTWLEENLGTLVPMEIVVNVPASSQLEQLQRPVELAQPAPVEPGLASGGNEPEVAGPDEPVAPVERTAEQFLAFSLLERMEISSRIRTQLERYFGPEGLNIVGAGMSTDIFAPLQIVADPMSDGSAVDYRRIFNDQLLGKRDMMRGEDFLAVADEPTVIGGTDVRLPAGREMWRISLRLAALNDVDYGRFVNDLKLVVEPILRAYEFRTRILEQVADVKFIAGGAERRQILLLGHEPEPRERIAGLDKATDQSIASLVDQTWLFSDTLDALLQNRGFRRGLVRDGTCFTWLDPAKYGGERPFPANDQWRQILARFDCVALVENDPLFDEAFIREHAVKFVDCRQHRYSSRESGDPASSSLTAMNRLKQGEPMQVAATYTGIIPIVYKAQRALLESLIQSIVMSFGLISITMMILLRNWRERPRPGNLLNFRGGLLSMLPNVFPVVLIFGALGFLGIKVDIGSMMTASVALGIAVDDTIHYLTWYRRGLAQGLSQHDSIRQAYRLCAAAMLQTSMIAGLGLSVFALSTFAPTQRFGVLMLVLLAAALFADLVVTPALLAGPLGGLFGDTARKPPSPEESLATPETVISIPLSRADSAESTTPQRGGTGRRRKEPF